MISSFRDDLTPSSPARIFLIAAVAIPVLGHNVLQAIPYYLNSSVIPYYNNLKKSLLRVITKSFHTLLKHSQCQLYQTSLLSKSKSKLKIFITSVAIVKGGEIVRMCGFLDFFK